MPKQLNFFLYFYEKSLAVCEVHSCVAARCALHVCLHLIQPALRSLLSPIVQKDVQEVSRMEKFLLGSCTQAIFRQDTLKTVLVSKLLKIFEWLENFQRSFQCLCVSLLLLALYNSIMYTFHFHFLLDSSSILYSVG